MPKETEVREALKVLRIRHLNDEARRHLTDFKVLFTGGITALPHEDQAAIFQRVCDFDDFSPENDPFDEHDYGSFVHKGLSIMWKIDYYDRDEHFGSLDPSDPTTTKRLLTVMLADEY